MTHFQVNEYYRYVGLKKHPRAGYGATSETVFKCVASGERFAVLYWDARVCGAKETTVIVEHNSNEWKPVNIPIKFMNFSVEIITSDTGKKSWATFENFFGHPFDSDVKYYTKEMVDSKNVENYLTFVTGTNEHAFFLDTNKTAYCFHVSEFVEESPIFIRMEDEEVELTIDIYCDEHNKYYARGRSTDNDAIQLVQSKHISRVITNVKFSRGFYEKKKEDKTV